MESVLASIKKLLGVDDNYFNADLMIHINTAFFTLHQLGIGPTQEFRIDNEYTEWSSFEIDDALLSTVKDYVYLKVKMLFDPPASSIVAEAINKSISELEWRLVTQAETPTLKESEE